ncbi:tripartite tricarboxylate transporter family receptor [Variibacter gotjawalensis]|uniref:Tripartite tricarboxylate transporter family receptor n=1 Tax=Variibacter gotjawalensis TaxID=1333996 RepID=A0A0S3PZI9_9BRAD|nr:tripartite tricarboxylate transporter substrate binding protein [Variibacter gotjawalensis]NIK47192.1 tripartite-type tricarboxylate transporter receptor subunit TctC [Variibacter gotjawalensis]RZS49092.1 tripartite-type tricarboxylate transporter receptor subunit TctC [Variibacter gotjawalensis]BAT61354.1 tripartite tricarboxylate transporter family receptor [Variibacter gotjawalensis]
MLSRRNLLRTAAGAGCLGALAQTFPRAHASAWPTGPVKIIVPYPPGGSSDIASRVVGQLLQEQIGQPFIIDNRAGAGGNIGMEAGARSAPDGYSLVLATTAHAINMTLFSKLNYDTVKGFAPIALLMEVPLICTVHPSVPANSVAELIALAKQKPKGINYGTSGNGQSTHMAVELFCMMAGIEMTHVPYRGSAPAMNDHIAGHVAVMFDTAASGLPHVQDKKLRALAVTSRERVALLPDVPTVAETGLKGYEVTAWNGLMAPVGTPPEIVDRLNREIVKALATPLVKERFGALAATARPTTVAEFTDYVRNEVEKWAPVVRQSGAKVD